MTQPFESAVGVVATFDDHAGFGAVRDVQGSEWSFHCVAIADGTRTVDIGAPVVYRLVPGGRGQWEATDLVKLPAGP